MGLLTRFVSLSWRTDSSSSSLSFISMSSIRYASRTSFVENATPRGVWPSLRRISANLTSFFPSFPPSLSLDFPSSICLPHILERWHICTVVVFSRSGCPVSSSLVVLFLLSPLRFRLLLLRCHACSRVDIVVKKRYENGRKRCSRSESERGEGERERKRRERVGNSNPDSSDL